MSQLYDFQGGLPQPVDDSNDNTATGCFKVFFIVIGAIIALIVLLWLIAWLFPPISSGIY